MTRVRIRHGTGSDDGRATEIEALSFPADVAESFDKTPRANRPDGLFVVAEVEGVIAGYAFGYKEGRAFNLDLIAVHPDYRRSKVATGLAQYAAAQAAQAGLGIVALKTAQPAVPFFTSLGYEFVEEGKALSWNRTLGPRGSFGQFVSSLCVMRGDEHYPFVAFRHLPAVMAANPQQISVAGIPDRSGFMLIPATDNKEVA